VEELKELIDAPDIRCAPETDVVGIVRCPQCGSDRSFDVTDMLCLRELDNEPA
jgi:hypothetical protein